MASCGVLTMPFLTDVVLCWIIKQTHFFSSRCVEEPLLRSGSSINEIVANVED